MNDRRAQQLVADGDRITDTATMRGYLADLDRRDARPVVVRLSLTGPASRPGHPDLAVLGHDSRDEGAQPEAPVPPQRRVGCEPRDLAAVGQPPLSDGGDPVTAPS